MKENYSIKDYITKPIVMKITAEEEILREKLMDRIIKTHQPVKAENIYEQKLISSMAEKNIIALNDNDEITSIYPVSALPTNKKVVFQDGSYAYAMCAIDAIGFHYAFNCPVTVEGQCEHCGKKIKLRIENGRIKTLEGGDDIHILHTDLENIKNWSCCCCNIMHFFICEDSLEEWTSERCLNGRIFSVDLETANKIAWLLFSK